MTVLGSVPVVLCVVGAVAAVATDTGRARGASAGARSSLPAEIVFTSEGPSSALPAGDALVLIDRTGQARRLLSAPRGSYALAWSPDGGRLAAVTNGSLTILQPGHRATRLALEGSVDLHLVWTPDGRRIVFQRGRRIFIADADGRRERLLAANALAAAEAGVSRFSLSPDGTQLVYGGRTGARHGLFIVRTDGTSAPAMIPLRGFASRVALRSPAWSPDGRWIAFDSWAPAVYVVKPDGSGRRRLGTGSGAAWSPDSSSVAFIGRGATNGVARVGGARRWTLPGCSCQLRGPGFWPSLSWSPDGSRIAYVSGKGLTISSVRPDGTGARRILQTSPSYPWEPLWRPR